MLSVNLHLTLLDFGLAFQHLLYFDWISFHALAARGSRVCSSNCRRLKNHLMKADTEVLEA